MNNNNNNKLINKTQYRWDDTHS